MERGGTGCGGDNGGLDADAAAAVDFVASGFRAGVPLRALLDAAFDAHGSGAWEGERTQAALLAATVDYVPPRAPPGFSFGAARAARFARLLLDEVEHLPAGAALCERLTQLCVPGGAPGAGAGGGRAALAHIALRVPAGGGGGGGGDELVLRAAPRGSDVGLRLWEAGVAQYLALLRSPQVRADVAGRSVLELGAGLGLCAGAFADAGARRVVMSDGDPAVVANLRGNCARWPVRCARVDVADVSAVADAARANAVDTVFAADLAYDPALAARTVRAMETVIEEAGPARRAVGYLFATSRSEKSDRALARAFDCAALDVEKMPAAVDAEAVSGSSFGVLLACNKSWNFCKVHLYRLT